MDPAATRPWLVLVSGEPGSGKTSLGLRLAVELRLPFLSRDQVRGGQLAAAGLWTGELHDPPGREAAVEALVQLVETAARCGTTAVVELVVTPERRHALRRLQAGADCLVILTSCRDAGARAERRDRDDPLLQRPGVLAALGHRSIDQHLAVAEKEAVRATMDREFDMPLLHVATDEGYDPPLEQVVDWVIEQTGRPRPLPR